MVMKNSQGDQDDMHEDMKSEIDDLNELTGLKDKASDAAKAQGEKLKNQAKAAKDKITGKDKDNPDDKSGNKKDEKDKTDPDKQSPEKSGNKKDKKSNNAPNDQNKKKDKNKKDGKDKKDGDKKDGDKKDGDKKDKSKKPGGGDGDGPKPPRLPRITPAGIAKNIARRSASEAINDPVSFLAKGMTFCFCCAGCIILPFAIILLPFLALFFWLNPSSTNNMAGIETTEAADADFEELEMDDRNPLFANEFGYDLFEDAPEDADKDEDSYANSDLDFTLDEQYLEMAKILYDNTNVALSADQEDWAHLITSEVDAPENEDDDGDKKNNNSEKPYAEDPKYNNWEIKYGVTEVDKLKKAHKEKAKKDKNFVVPPEQYYLNVMGSVDQYKNLGMGMDDEDMEEESGITIEPPSSEKKSTTKFKDGTFSGRINDGKTLEDTRSPGTFHPGDLSIGLSFDPKEYRNGNLGNHRMPKPESNAPYVKNVTKFKLSTYNEKSEKVGGDGEGLGIQPKLGTVVVSADEEGRPSIPYGTRLHIPNYGYGIVTESDENVKKSSLVAFLPSGVKVNTDGVKDVSVLVKFPWEYDKLWAKTDNKNQAKLTAEEKKIIQKRIDDDAKREKGEKVTEENLPEGAIVAKEHPDARIGKLDPDTQYVIAEQKETLVVPHDKKDKTKASTNVKDFNFDPTLPQFNHLLTIKNIENSTGNGFMEKQIAYLLAGFSVSRGNSSPIGGFIRDFNAIVKEEGDKVDVDTEDEDYDFNDLDIDEILDTNLRLVSEAKTRLLWTKETKYEPIGGDSDNLQPVTTYGWKPYSYNMFYLDVVVNPYNHNKLLKAFFEEEEVAKDFQVLHIRHKLEDDPQLVATGEAEDLDDIDAGQAVVPLTEAEAKKEAKWSYDHADKKWFKEKVFKGKDLTLGSFISEDKPRNLKNGYIITQKQLKDKFDTLPAEEQAFYGYVKALPKKEREKYEDRLNLSKKDAKANYVFQHILLSDYHDWLLQYLYDCTDKDCTNTNKVTVKDKRVFEFEPEWFKKDKEYSYGTTNECPGCGEFFVQRKMKFTHWLTMKIVQFGKDKEEKDSIRKSFALPRQEHAKSEDLDYYHVTEMNDDGEFDLAEERSHTIGTKIEYFAQNSLETIEVATRLEEFGLAPASGDLYGEGDGSGIVEVAFDFMNQFQNIRKSVNDDDPIDGRGKAYFNTRFYGSNQKQPWCAIFVSICAEDAGIDTSIIPKDAGVLGHVNFAKKENRFHKRGTYTPKPGDLIIYWWKNGPNRPNHIGIVSEVKPDGTICTIEGNTSGEALASNGNLERNGNTIYTKERSPSYGELYGFIEVDYPEGSFGGVANIPKHKNFKSYMDHKFLTLQGSVQVKLQQQAKTDKNGFRRYKGRYMVAVGSYWGSPGDLITITLQNGVKIKAVIGDQKADAHTDAKHQFHKSDGSFVEFIVHTPTLNSMVKRMGDCSYTTHADWKPPCVEIVNESR